MTVLALLAVCAGGYIGAAGSGDEAVEMTSLFTTETVLVDSSMYPRRKGRRAVPTNRSWSPPTTSPSLKTAILISRS